MENNFEKMLENYLFNEVKVGTVVEGVVVRSTDTDVFVDFGWKGEGVIPTDELVKEPSEYKPGTKINLLVLRINEEEGTALLSERRVYLRKARELIKEKFENGEKVIGKIKERVKGGYKVLIDNVIEAFLPGRESLIRSGDKIPEDYLEFKIIKFNASRKKLNIVVSRKIIVDEMIDSFYSNRKPGDVIEGLVEKVEKFGAFIRIAEGITGLLPNSEVSYDTSLTVEDVLREGQSVKLLIKDIDRNKKRIILSLKALMPDPWENIEKKYPIGEVVSGIVKKIMPFGFFVNLEPGIDGLVHISEVFWGRQGRIQDVVEEGDVVKVIVKDVDKENRKLSLSYKEAKGDPWKNIEEKYPVGNVVTGVVGAILNSGVIIDLEEEISGFCPISELSWKYVEKPEEVVTIKQKVKAVVTSLDKDARKMRLSIKRATQNPWKLFVENYKEGDIVTGKIVKKVKKGYIVEIDDIEAFLPETHALEEKNVGDQLTGRILKIVEDKEIYKITISEKLKEEIEQLKELSEKANAERVVSLEGKVKNANSTDSREE
ncbi:S1 RNA-binding domain-containing protein [Thermosipho atlanticus]|uniref:Small subunit ribosomal protein S1 n=1 Tax=Thermosipho atlanticus DSM 15807 TaxID=1123380 RepID=A0A1M5RAS8_9BACT|nr:S1 RNA-binding domain-containing protein [Thermosipho atlanticus]SHH22913.1 small subunit ribosomal protein S1 [Thermosipho atlanticus DSM 15807]